MKNKSYKNGFAIKILSMSVAQFLLFGCVLIVIAGSSLRAGMQTENVNGLESIARTVQVAYNNLDNGDYLLNESNELLKGMNY